MPIGKSREDLVGKPAGLAAEEQMIAGLVADVGVGSAAARREEMKRRAGVRALVVGEALVRAESTCGQ